MFEEMVCYVSMFEEMGGVRFEEMGVLGLRSGCV